MNEKGFSIPLSEPVEVRLCNGIIAGLAVISIAVSQLSAAGKMLLFLGLSLLCYRIWQGHWPLLAQQPKPHGLRYENQAWWLLDGDKTLHLVTNHQAFVSRWLVIIHFHSDRFGTSSVILSKSSIDPSHFRKLRCLLRRH